MCVGVCVRPWLCDIDICVSFVFFNHLAEEERVGCYTLIVFNVSL